nr:MAG TPA: hypothetical protein [Caudoviricetes sp.]
MTRSNPGIRPTIFCGGSAPSVTAPARRRSTGS